MAIRCVIGELQPQWLLVCGSVGEGVPFQTPPHSPRLRRRMLVYLVPWRKSKNNGRGPRLLGLQGTVSLSESVVPLVVGLQAPVLRVLDGFRI